jgi:3-hydroxy-3-methylglutaryl CoA synthase
MKLQDIHLCLFVVHKQKTTIVGDTIFVCRYLSGANVDIYH